MQPTQQPQFLPPPPQATYSGATLEDRLARLPTEELLLMQWRLKWRREARAKQLAPPAPWKIWGIRSGRGWGKTKTGANWIGIEAACEPGSYNFIIAPTHDDVRQVCFEGPTGILSVIPRPLIKAVNLALPSVTLWNGATLRGFAAETPERLRGPQCNRGWCDEIASWRYPKQVWDNYRFGLRLGTAPRTLWTSTLKPTPFIRDLLKLPDSVIVSGSTYENRNNLPQDYFDDIAKYEGTKIGRQEIYGELIDPEDSGYVQRSQWRLWKYSDPLPHFHFVLLSLDTAFTEATFNKREQAGDPTACSVWGVFEFERKINVMLLDSWQDHLGFPALVDRVKKDRAAEYGAGDESLDTGRHPLYGKPMYGAVRKGAGRKADLVLIEDKGSGISLRQALAADNILTTPYNPGHMDKLARLHAISPLFAAGRVWAVESAKRPGEFISWADPLLSQVCSYVGAGSLEHDDLLDTTTQALKYVMDRFMQGSPSAAPPALKDQLLNDEVRRRRVTEPAYG